MSISPYQHMQAAVDAIPSSPHPTSKVAATLVSADGKAHITRTNFWPAPIAEKIGTDTRIGAASGTIHAETVCLLTADFPAEGAAIYITDPPCPNCVKNMAEAGITALYIDHKGFYKDFARRRGGDFENMSLRICQKAGIDVFEIWRKDQHYKIILQKPVGFEPAQDNPVGIEPADSRDFKACIETLEGNYADEPYACALTRDQNGQSILLHACAHPVIGYTRSDVESKDGKYSFWLQPLNRIMMAAARRNLAIDRDQVFSSRTPTARELVNFIGGGFDTLRIGTTEKARDENGPKALSELQDAGVLSTNN